MGKLIKHSVAYSNSFTECAHWFNTKLSHAFGILERSQLKPLHTDDKNDRERERKKKPKHVNKIIDAPNRCVHDMQSIPLVWNWYFIHVFPKFIGLNSYTTCVKYLTPVEPFSMFVTFTHAMLFLFTKPSSIRSSFAFFLIHCQVLMFNIVQRSAPWIHSLSSIWFSCLSY